VALDEHGEPISDANPHKSALDKLLEIEQHPPKHLHALGKFQFVDGSWSSHFDKLEVQQPKAKDALESATAALNAFAKTYVGKPSKADVQKELIALSDWDPADHPKDDEGKFVEKGHGTYTHGKFKKAVFAIAGKLISHELKDGDVAYELNTHQKDIYGNPQVTNAVVIKHADGTVDILQPNGSLTPAGFVAKQAANSGTLKVLASKATPGTSTESAEKLHPSIQKTGSTYKFTHPVSGESMHFGVHMEIYQHKVSPNSFLIYNPSHPQFSQFFTKNGKKQKAPQHALKHKDTNYTLIHAAKAQEATSGTVGSPSAPQTAPPQGKPQPKAPEPPTAPVGASPFESPAKAFEYVADIQSQLENYLGLTKFWYANEFGLKESSPLKTDPLGTLTSPKFKALSTAPVEVLAKVNGTNWPATTKMNLGTTRARFEVLSDIGLLAAQLQDTNSDEQQVNSLVSSIFEKLNNPGKAFGKDFPIPATDLALILNAEHKQWKFKKNAPTLPFDIDTASVTTLTSWISQQGVSAAGGFSLEQAKSWIKLHIHEPKEEDLYLNPALAKADLEKTALIQVATAQGHIYLKSLAPDPQKVAEAKATAEKSKADTYANIVAEMNTGYEAPSESLGYFGPDQWLYVSAADLSKYVTTAQALDMIKTGKWKGVGDKVSGKPSYDSAYKTFTTAHGPVADMSTGELNGHLKTFGASYVGKMSNADKRMWLQMYLAGDTLALFTQEANAASKSNIEHKDIYTHPGSPQSPQGKAAYQALSNYVNSFPWGKKFIDGEPLSSTEHTEATNVLPWLTVRAKTTSMQSAFLAQWRYNHSALANFPSTVTKAFEPPKDPSIPPAGIDKDAWALVLSSEAEGENKQLDKLLSSVNSLGIAGVPLAILKTAPLRTQKLATWAKMNNREDVVQAFMARIDSGAYISGGTPVWTAPDGKTFAVPPGSTIYQHATNKNIFAVQGPTGGFKYSTESKTATSMLMSEASALKQGTAPQANYKKLFQIPNELTYEQASKDIGVSKFVWDSVEKAEQGKLIMPSPFGIYSDSQVNLYLTLNVPKTIEDNLDKLPLHVKKLAAWALSTNDISTLKLIEYKTKNGAYSAGTMHQLLDPNASFSQQIMSGHTSASDLAVLWSTAQLQDLKKVLGLPPTTTLVETHASLLKTLDVDAPPPAVNAPPEQKTGIPQELVLKKVPKKLGGMHSKTVWADQNGNEWMAKAFPNDPNSKARINAEHAANAIGVLHGYGNPETRTMSLEGTYSYVQHLKPASGDFTGKSPATMNIETLSQAMEEHVLDWLTSNHDTHPQNMLLAENGKDVIGIDKGQAWKFFGMDKLQHGYLPLGNPQQVWYDEFYSALKNGKIDKATADSVTRRVLSKAWRTQKNHDDATRELLKQAFKDHKNFPGSITTPASMVDGVMARKANLLKDFEKFYKDLYAASPHKWDIDVEKLKKAQLDEHTHVSITPDLAKDVKLSGSHGKALLFNTQDLHDSHLLLYVEQVGKGQALMMQGSVRKDADKIITNWLKAQTVTNDLGTKTDTGAAYEPEKPSHLVLPFNETWFAKVLAGVKTVNHHQGDGEYNLDTLNSMDATKNEIFGWKGKLAKHEMATPNKPFTVGATTFITKEQQDAWKAMLDQYLGDIEKVQTAKAGNAKVAPPKIVVATYTPSPNLDTSSFLPGAAKNKPSDAPDTGSGVPTWTTSEGKVYKYNGSIDDWEVEGEDGVYFTNDEMAAIAQDLEGSIVYDPGTGAKEVEAQGTTQVEQKTLKVTKRQAYGSQGTYDHDKGLLVYTGKLKQGFTGYQYDVEYGNVRIEYRPHNEPGVSTSQQGLLKVRVEDWNGSEAQIADVMDTLKTMGLSADEADEEGLELFYWRHLRGILSQRVDRKEPKWKQVLDKIKAEESKHPHMTPSEELNMLKGAWALAMGKDVVDKANWRPQFSRFRPHSAKENQSFTSGHPYWLRPDFKLSQLKKIYGKSVPASTVGNSSSLDALVSSGGSLTTEERLRVLGQFLTGMSSSADQNKGSAGHVFMRQNKTTSSFGQLFYHPRVVLRTTNYAFNGDYFGNKASRATKAYFDLAKASQHNASNNELMVKYGVSVLDDVAAIRFPSEAVRQKAIKRLKDLGITHLHGIPIEQLFVTSAAEAQKAIDKIWEIALKEEQQ
jgi:hypothetical protein